MTDETLDAYFREKESVELAIARSKKYISGLENKLILAAEERIFEVVADPNNKEAYGKPSISYNGIKDRLLKEEPRFTDHHINAGLGKLLREGKIENKNKEYIVKIREDWL